ncbi:unnamed protein product [Tuber aestivum]|uniref:Uncharacterized protein n=1 Tax=Tuber aestivum TaxID=59557 RepID=A0A292PP78_9PEZI|nr:unnamed protein product [Tuber aestivum]
MFRSLNFLSPSWPLTRSPFLNQLSLHSSHYRTLAISATQYRSAHSPPELSTPCPGPQTECGTMWCELCQAQERDLRSDFREMLRETKRAYEYYLKEPQEELNILRKRACTLSKDINDTKNQIMQLKRNFNPCTALERIANHGRIGNKTKRQETIQSALDELAKGKNFRAILREEVESRRLVEENVMECVHKLYDTASEHATARSTTVVVRASEFAINERAALVVFLKLLDAWGDPLGWREEKLPNEGR